MHDLATLLRINSAVAAAKEKKRARALNEKCEARRVSVEAFRAAHAKAKASR